MNNPILSRISSHHVLMLIVLLVPLYINKSVHEFRVNQVMLLKLLLLVTLAIWVIEMIVQGKKRLRTADSMGLFLWLFMGLLTLSLLRSRYLMVSWRDYLLFIAYFIMFFLVIHEVKTHQQFNLFIKLFFLTALVIALYALLHYYGLDPYLGEIRRQISTIGQKNWVSGYLAMIFSVAFSYFLLAEDRKKVIYFLLLTVLYTVLVIFQSRGIWISVGLTILFSIFLLFKSQLFPVLKKNKRWLFILGITLAFITIIYATENPFNKSRESMTQQITSIYENQFSSLNSRLLLWHCALEMVKDRPLLGIGIGLFKMDFLDYQADFLKQNPKYLPYHTRAEETHNEYLQLAAELGIIGLGIFLYILFIFYRSALAFLMKKEEQKSEREKIILWGLLMGITCFLFHSGITFPFHVPALGSAFSIIVALTWVYLRSFKVHDYQSNHLQESITRKGRKKNQRRKKLSKNNCQNVLRYMLIGIILILTVAGIYYIAIKPYKADQRYFKGVAYYQAKEYSKAEIFFEKAFRLDPYNGRILYALGTSYLQTNQPDKARQILEQAQNYIQEINLYRNLSLTYQQLGDKQSARQALLRVIKLDSQSVADKLNLAELYAADNDYEKAIDYFLKVLEVEPDYPGKEDIYYQLGVMHQKNNEPFKAQFYFQQRQEK